MAIDGGLRSIFRESIPQWHWQPIESGLTGLGIPDSNCCADGKEFWVEYKKCEGNAIKIRKEQVSWHERRARNGGLTFVAIRKQSGPVDELYLFSGKFIRALFVRGLNCGVKPLGQWSGGPSKWNWQEVADILTERHAS